MKYLKDITINYELLSEAIKFYASRGYEQVELPWMVSSSNSMLTCPDERYVFKAIDGDAIKHLVGSAEQAFIQEAHLSYKLKSYKKYMAVTPCFRRTENDETHSEQFIKLELFKCTDAPSYFSIEQAHHDFYDENPLNQTEMLNDALDLYRSFGGRDLVALQIDANNPYEESTKNSRTMHTINSFDIYGKDSHGKLLEVGSYGLRRIDIKKMSGIIRQWYTYGTGIALPRFQLVL